MLEPLKAVNDFLREGGWLAVLIFILYSGYKLWWVFGPFYRQSREGEEFWKGKALSLMAKGKTAVAVGETLAGIRKSDGE